MTIKALKDNIARLEKLKKDSGMARLATDS